MADSHRSVSAERWTADLHTVIPGFPLSPEWAWGTAESPWGTGQGSLFLGHRDQEGGSTLVGHGGEHAGFRSPRPYPKWLRHEWFWHV